jgi:hypothetical protein
MTGISQRQTRPAMRGVPGHFIFDANLLSAESELAWRRRRPQVFEKPALPVFQKFLESCIQTGLNAI